MKEALFDPKGKAMIESNEAAATSDEVSRDPANTEVESRTAMEGKDEEASAAAIETESISDETVTAPEPSSVPTLREVFELPEKGEGDPDDDRWQAIEERIGQEIKGIKWSAAMSDLVPKICDLLEIRVDGVLLAAWKKASEIRTVLEKSRQTPEETTYVELAEHTINSEHKPSIDVKLRGAKLKTIALLVHLGFNLQGFVLKIKNGSIIEMQAGKCDVKGTIKFSGLTIAEKKLAPIKLPFIIPIDAPDEVAPPAATEAEQPEIAESPERIVAAEAEQPEAAESHEKIAATEAEQPETEESHERIEI
jgi:hypothetical protein